MPAEYFIANSDELIELKSLEDVCVLMERYGKYVEI